MYKFTTLYGIPVAKFVTFFMAHVLLSSKKEIFLHFYPILCLQILPVFLML